MNAFFFSFFFVFGLLVNKGEQVSSQKKAAAAAVQAEIFLTLPSSRNTQTKETKHNAKRARVQCSSKQ